MKNINIYPKSEGVMLSEWGNGYGQISPHCDDLYEKINCDLLSLTLFRCKEDKTTSFYSGEKLIYSLSDLEIETLLTQKAVFISGKNVNNLVLQKEDYVLKKNNNNFCIKLDFRIENNKPRMYSNNTKCQAILNKLRKRVFSFSIRPNCRQGSFILIDNTKVLHGRETKLKKDEIDNSRLVYRSKGQQSIYPTGLNYDSN